MKNTLTHGTSDKRYHLEVRFDDLKKPTKVQRTPKGNKHSNDNTSRIQKYFKATVTQKLVDN